MKFDFEKYWEEKGIKTDPAVMGLAFKEIAEKSAAEVINFYEAKINDGRYDADLTTGIFHWLYKNFGITLSAEQASDFVTMLNAVKAYHFKR